MSEAFADAPGPIDGRPSIEVGRKPVQISTIGASARAGIISIASDSSQWTPPAVNALLYPTYLRVAPITSRPSARGTMYGSGTFVTTRFSPTALWSRARISPRWSTVT